MKHFEIAGRESRQKRWLMLLRGHVCTIILAGGTFGTFGNIACAGVPATVLPVDVASLRYELYSDPLNGNTIGFGGFSGLFPVPGRSDWLYAVTDRGPNPDFVNAGVAGKIFVRPDFGPHIISLHLHPAQIAKIADVRSLKNPSPSGGTVSGLPPTPTVTRQAPEVLWDLTLNIAPTDEDGLDTEGMTMDESGNYWLCEEYKPSIAMVDNNGMVKMRLVPKGTLSGAETIPSFDVLPRILKERYNNRGLEGIAYANGVIYSIMQRPLSNPNARASETSHNIRLLAIDLQALSSGAGQDAVKQFIYRTEPFAAPFTSDRGVYASDLFAVSPTKFLVPERQTDKLYCFDLSTATDITGKEDEAGVLVSSPNPNKTTIEQLTLAELTALGVVPVVKKVVLPSLTAIDPVLAKCEGVCLMGQTIVLTHDNDFNVNPATAVPNPEPEGPFVQINLQNPPNAPTLFLVPLPAGALD